MRIGTRRMPRTATLGLVLVPLVMAINDRAQEPGQKAHRSAPRFEGATIPDPPQQGRPWTAPETSLPGFLVRASTTLFEQGLADPRGGDYRAIEISVGGVWSDAGSIVETHGWVLPGAPGDKTRFAVAWSGLVYPTVSVGDPADLAADVKTLEDAARARLSTGAQRSGRGETSAFGGFGTNHEAFPVSLESLHPIKVALLLRLGRADLAERIWAAATGRPRDEAGKAKVKLDLTNYGVSYLTMATDLAWHHFDRAICAHMRGDDAVALADARFLNTFQKAVEAKAQAMGFPRPQSPGNRGDAARRYIDFLGQLPEFLADHERRAREPKRPPIPAAGTDKKARIAALIANLDEIYARQFGQPGGVSLGESPIIQALIQEGDDAVEPLIDDLERDTRLTRSVHFWRDFARWRTVMGAHEAAYTALSGILKTSFFRENTTGGNLTGRGLEGRKAVADSIREYWEKNRGVPLAERWYRTLADDVASPGEWLQAAGNIVQHENVRIIPGSTAFTETVTTPLAPGARPKLRGEVLRAKKDPSVADLMAMRAKELDPGEPIAGQNGRDQYRVTLANQMASMLAEWDIKAAVPVLKARVDRCAQAVREGQKAGQRIHGLEQSIADLTDLRARSGDPGALRDYASWIRTLTPDHFDFFPIGLFGPMWRHPDDPAIVGAANALFEDPRSPWNPPVWRGGTRVRQGHQLELFASPLLGLKAFRTLVLRALDDRTEVGTVEVDAQGRIIIIQGQNRTIISARSTSSGFSQNPSEPGPGAMPLRMADLACEKLEPLEGMPRFQKHWPIAKRDEAIAATVAFLKHYGERFRENAASRAIRAAEPGIPNHEKAILAFDPLDHPATAKEVADGRAVFSLEGEGAEVRRIALPSFPIAGRWTKLEVFPDDPSGARVFDNKGKNRATIEPMQTGRVWQTEEVREGGGWRRYYGFVGRHTLARVPAEEVEFPAGWQRGWRKVSADLDARIIVKDAEAAATGPIPVEVRFRNHRGVETTAPAELVRVDVGAMILREGIDLRLTRLSDRPDLRGWFAALPGGGSGQEKPFPPEEIAPRPIRRHSKGPATRTLAPGDDVLAFQVDLRTIFPVDRPGRYRLEVRFDDLKTPDGPADPVTSEFGVAAPAKD